MSLLRVLTHRSVTGFSATNMCYVRCRNKPSAVGNSPYRWGLSPKGTAQAKSHGKTVLRGIVYKWGLLGEVTWRKITALLPKIGAYLTNLNVCFFQQCFVHLSHRTILPNAGSQ